MDAEIGRNRILVLPADPAIEEAVRDAVGDSGSIVRPVSRTAEAVRELLPDADIVVADWSGRLSLGAEEAALGRHLRLIQQPGVGIAFIDVDAWAEAGVPVANTPGGNAASVAEWAVAATANLCRSIGWADAEMRSGRWPQASILQRDTRDLGERRVGLVGFGDINRRCATLFRAFGCEVAYTSRRPDPSSALSHRALDDLLAESDVLVVAVPLTTETRGLIGARELALLPREALVVNVARGPVVDEVALAGAIRSGSVAGAALDVFAAEPLDTASELFDLDNVVLSPHIAGGSSTARRRMFRMTGENVARVCRGEAPLWTVG
ncbi:2-hydroxyacid dehydrogenase [Prescottella agglutinans]|uniref:D-3-phosphoglycerate dehydrogenase n=1 Tax=Prescottella agglutinans TaxID=1644129 RepID=A0ABT6M7F4_9NOCA|nr:2-hydroxyacid dehydrogenase [Prescottella agglutinans]MDH6280245.1 D-3-phosphoglycerate dehydrogenase [Prescottella agglutinans]